MTDAKHPTASDFQRLIQGHHDDPFALLGPHFADDTQYVTAFDPGAHQMWAVIDGTSHPLDPVQDAPGVFRGKVPGDAPYHLKGAAQGSHSCILFSRKYDSYCKQTLPGFSSAFLQISE